MATIPRGGVDHEAAFAIVVDNDGILVDLQDDDIAVFVPLTGDALTGIKAGVIVHITGDDGGGSLKRVSLRDDAVGLSSDVDAANVTWIPRERWATMTNVALAVHAIRRLPH